MLDENTGYVTERKGGGKEEAFLFLFCYFNCGIINPIIKFCLYWLVSPWK